MFTSADFKNNSTAYVAGKEVKVISSYQNTVIIEYPDGTKSLIPISQLKQTPLFDLQSKKDKIKERDEKIEYYRQLASDAEAAKEKTNVLISEISHQMQGLNKKSKEFGVLLRKFWNAKFERTSYANQSYSYSLDAFLVASSTKYC